MKKMLLESYATCGNVNVIKCCSEITLVYGHFQGNTLPIITYLVYRGICINDILMNCASDGYELGVRYAVERGSRDEYALEYAASAGHTDIVLYLVGAGFTVRRRAIIWSAMNGHKSIARYLMNHVDSELRTDVAEVLSGFLNISV